MLYAKTRPSLEDRRRFMRHTWAGVAGALSLALVPGGDLFGARRFGRNPFTLGVASGDPTSDGIVLWTRLAPSPVDPQSLGRSAIPVAWRVARDSRMRHVVAKGVAAASPELAHSLHVEVEGLLPGRDMVQHDLDLVLHLGDYTYEYAIGSTTGRGIPPPDGFERETVDLLTYRLRHTLYKLDPDLQAAHARFPFVVIWDDHEVANDYSGLAPEFGEPSAEFTARRAAAYQAYYEHMPIRSAVARNPRNGLQIYRRLRYGQLVEFTMLDDRQYRTDNPCGDGESLRCDAALEGDYTMLGRQQEQWVGRGFEKSSARWNVVAQQLLLAQLEHATIQPDWFWNDAWDGYPLARQRLLSGVVDARLRNPVFLTGDWHSTFVNDLKLDFNDPRADTVATEFVTPAITTGGDGTPYGPYYAPMIPFNPHIKYYEGDRRGYFKAVVTPNRMSVDLRFVTSVEDPNGSGYTEGSWVVEDGRPGASRA